MATAQSRPTPIPPELCALLGPGVPCHTVGARLYKAHLTAHRTWGMRSPGPAPRFVKPVSSPSFWQRRKRDVRAASTNTSAARWLAGRSWEMSGSPALPSLGAGTAPAPPAGFTAATRPGREKHPGRKRDAGRAWHGPTQHACDALPTARCSPDPPPDSPQNTTTAATPRAPPGPRGVPKRQSGRDGNQVTSGKSLSGDASCSASRRGGTGWPLPLSPASG